MHCNFNIIIYMQDKKTAVLYNRAPTSQPLVPSLKKYATLSPYLS